MKIVTAFPDIQQYEDRIAMYHSLSGIVDSFHLLTRPSFDASRFGKYANRIQFHLLDRKGAYGFQISAFKYCRDLLLHQDPSRVNQIIVQDVFYGRLAIPYKLLSSNRKKDLNIKNVLALYFPNIRFFFERLWRKTGKDSYSLAEDFYYVRRFLRTILFDYVSSKCVDAIYCNSLEIAEGFRRYFHFGGRIAVIPTEIEVGRYDMVKRLNKQELGLPEKPIILFAGTIHGRKGIYHILDALKILKEHKVDFLMVFVGPVFKYDLEDLMRFIYNNNLQQFVIFTGQKDFKELVSYYSNADLFLFPSISEGSPRVIKEAMICECPVLASDIPGIKMLDPSGEIINQVPVGDTNRLATLTETLLKNPELRRIQARRGRELILREFSSAAVANRILEFYCSLF